MSPEREVGPGEWKGEKRKWQVKETKGSGHFSKEDILMAKKHMKKMFNNISHYGNANQNH